MKKAIFLILMFSVAVLLAGCGQKSINAPEKTPVKVINVQTTTTAPVQQTADSTNAIGNEINGLSNLDSEIDMNDLNTVDQDLDSVS